MQKNKKDQLSNTKILEILNSGEKTYSANQAEKIKNILTKFSSISYKIWNGKS